MCKQGPGPYGCPDTEIKASLCSHRALSTVRGFGSQPCGASSTLTPFTGEKTQPLVTELALDGPRTGAWVILYMLLRPQGLTLRHGAAVTPRDDLVPAGGPVGVSINQCHPQGAASPLGSSSTWAPVTRESPEAAQRYLGKKWPRTEEVFSLAGPRSCCPHRSVDNCHF